MLCAPSVRLLRRLAAICLEDCPPLLRHREILSTAVRRQSTYRPKHKQNAFRSLRATFSTASRQAQESTASVSTPTQPQTPPRPTLPDLTNHYTLFPHTLPAGPPPSGPFNISLPTLRKEFLHLQSLHHPDKYPSEPAHSKSVALSTRINEAYKTLSDPLLCAQYLLLHNYGIDVMSEDNSSHPTDQGTLMEVMEAQEMIEEAGGEGDIERLKDENGVRIEETVAKMGHAFEADDVERAKNECVRLKYWRSLQDGLRDWEPGKEVRLIH